MAKTEEPEMIAVSTAAGALFPLTLRRYMPGKVTKLGASSFMDLFQEPGIDIGLVAGIPSVALAMLGKDGKGPLAYNASAINSIAAFGGGALASTVGIAMFSLREQAEAAGMTLEPLGGSSSASAGLDLSNSGSSSNESTTSTNPAGVGLPST